MPGSGPDDLNEEADIITNPPITVDPLPSQGFEEVFSLLKTYFETRLEHRDKELENKQRSKRPEGSQQGGTIIAEKTKFQRDRSLSNSQTRVKPAGTQQYECQDIASDDEDDKKIRNARAETNRKRKQKKRERQQQSSKRRCTTPNRGTADHHLASGFCIGTVFNVRSFCYSLRCFVFFSCFIGSS